MEEIGFEKSCKIVVFFTENLLILVKLAFGFYLVLIVVLVKMKNAIVAVFSIN